MRIITDTVHDHDYPPLAATVGCFDGMHRGHAFLISQVCAEAEARQLKSALITFPVHPRQVIQPDRKPELLTCLPQKIELMQKCGADFSILLPFTHELSLFSALDFMRLLRDKFSVKSLVIGYDHRFGHNRLEDISDYRRYGEMLGIRVVQARALIDDGVSVSSSLIRKLLKSGAVSEANRYLGYNYCFDGIVEDGYKVGRTLGFPTANIRTSCSEKLIPAVGVYAAYVHLEGSLYPSVVNIGFRPTFTDCRQLSIEVNLLHFSGDIYRRQLKVELVSYIRPEHKFQSAEQLVLQIRKDSITAENILK